MSYISIIDYQPYPGVDYMDVEDMTEPGQVASMREIVYQFCSGIKPAVNVYDNYDESLESTFEPGTDIFDVLDEQRALSARIDSAQKRKTQLSGARSKSDGDEVEQTDIQQNSSDTE